MTQGRSACSEPLLVGGMARSAKKTNRYRRQLLMACARHSRQTERPELLAHHPGQEVAHRMRLPTGHLHDGRDRRAARPAQQRQHRSLLRPARLVMNDGLRPLRFRSALRARSRCALREPLDAGDVPRPLTCRAAAPGLMPVVCSAVRPRSRGHRCRHGGERRPHQARQGCAAALGPLPVAPGWQAAPRSSPARRSTAKRRPSMPATCRAARTAPPRHVLAGADRWGVLGSRIKHYRSLCFP
jgi:hypothetical protein